MENKNPTGAQMIERTRRMKDMVQSALEDYPPCRGDDMLLYIYVLRKNYWRLVRISTANGSLSLDFGSFENVMKIPSFESARRRRQEIFENIRHQIERGEIASSRLLPTERVRHKRHLNESAHRHEFGIQQRLEPSDYILEG